MSNEEEKLYGLKKGHKAEERGSECRNLTVFWRLPCNDCAPSDRDAGSCVDDMEVIFRTSFLLEGTPGLAEREGGGDNVSPPDS